MAGPHTIGWNYGSSGSNSTRSGSVVSWSRFANLFADDTNCESLTWTYPWGGTSDWAVITGFDFSSLPSDAVITGIRVKIRGKYLGTGFDVRMDSIYVTKNGTGYQDRASDDTSIWTTSLTDKYWGTTSTLWGTTWTRAEAASQIGVQFSYFGNCVSDGGIGYTDSIAVEVTYFIPSASPSISPSPSASVSPSLSPSKSPSLSPSVSPSRSLSPSLSPSISPSLSPSLSPSQSPSRSLSPSLSPSISPSISPSVSPSLSPSLSPSASPSPSPGWKDYTRGDYDILPTDVLDLETAYSAQDVTDVGSLNSVRVAQTATDQYAVHLFKNFATNAAANITCNCRSTYPCTVSPIIMELYNFVSTVWVELVRNSVAGADTDINLTANNVNLANYLGPGNIVACRVYQEAKY